MAQGSAGFFHVVKPADWRKNQRRHVMNALNPRLGVAKIRRSNKGPAMLPKLQSNRLAFVSKKRKSPLVTKTY